MMYKTADVAQVVIFNRETGEEIMKTEAVAPLRHVEPSVKTIEVNMRDEDREIPRFDLSVKGLTWTLEMQDVNMSKAFMEHLDLLSMGVRDREKRFDVLCDNSNYPRKPLPKKKRIRKKWDKKYKNEFKIKNCKFANINVEKDGK